MPKNDNAISLIKYEGNNNILVFKHPIVDFNTGTQLIVHESQEAIFFKDGKALDSFVAGRYTLENNNLPYLCNYYKIPTDSKDSIFHTEVYFINLTTLFGIKWGTESKIRMFDPASGLHIELGASGQFNIRVSNARKLLIKVVGTENSLMKNELVSKDFSVSTMTGKFRSVILTKIKSLLPKIIREENINILEIDEHLENLSILLKNNINQTLEDYGLQMPEFYVTTILTPDDDPNFRKMKEQYAERFLLIQEEKIKKAEAEARKERKVVEAETFAKEEIIKAQAEAEAYRLKAQAEAAEMAMKGYSYEDETRRQVAKAAMENQGSATDASGVVGSMMGLGVGLGVMGGVVNTVKEAVNPALDMNSKQNNEIWECPNCHSKNSTAFCPNCGIKKPSNESWNCSCGTNNITSNFCPNCGHKKGE